MIRPRLRIPQAGALLRRAAPYNRSYHVIPQLDQFNAENGVPGLLSPDGYNTAWTEYMKLVTEKLNYLTAGTEYEQQDALTILKSTARDSSSAALFNYASMAHNNHFFFKQLVNLEKLYENKVQAHALGQVAPTPKTEGEDDDIVARAVEAAETAVTTETTETASPAPQIELEPSAERIPEKLKIELEQHFSSIETLRRELYATAMGMFGPGFVWLVKNAISRDLRIVNTYLAGSPYTAAHWRRQGVDFNTSSGNRNTVHNWFDRSAAGAGNNTGRFEPQAPGGTDVIPLLCLNTWEHVWLTDYGIRGKSQYIQQWWETIDWHKVEKLALVKQRDSFRV
ncbi:manganese and iron superoxide dismutase [Xylariaceae sp. FL0594]|nr:manganese and iron superoxide dismutase [Xylariaceae sp. FL0594]